MASGFCKLHQRTEKLVKAHIIPKSFFPSDQQKGDAPAKTYQGFERVTRRRTPIGWYDKYLCCRGAENLFSPWDDYVAKILKPLPKRSDWLRGDDGLIAKDRGYSEAYWIHDVNYEKIKLLFLSLLWRASVSSRLEFGAISVGSSEAKLRDMILRKEPGNSEQYSVFITRFAERSPKTQVLFHPFIDEIDGVRFAMFTFGGYISRIKIEDSPTPTDIVNLQLTENKSLLIVQTRFEKSQIHKLAMKMVSSFDTP